MSFKAVGKEAVHNFGGDSALMMAAGLAYYTLLSTGPILLVLLWLATMIGEDAHGPIVERANEAFGEQAGGAIQTLLESVSQQQDNRMSGIVGIVGALVGATLVFAQLQDAVNRIWHVQLERGAVTTWLWKRLMGLVMIVILGALLLGSFVLASVLAPLLRGLPGGPIVWTIIQIVIPFGLAIVLYALIYKILPDAHTDWRSVWLGALVTAILSVLAVIALNIYMSFASPESAYGAAGWIIVLLLWAYYGAIVFMFGAELTAAYARREGEVRPMGHSQWVDGEKPPRQEH